MKMKMNRRGRRVYHGIGENPHYFLENMVKFRTNFTKIGNKLPKSIRYL
jgi:hypothetical protein